MIRPHEIVRRERFGALYNFHCTQYIAPIGWRVATWNDFDVLRSFVDPAGSGNSNIAGDQLASTYLWLSVLYSDIFDYTALPGGYRQDNGAFSSLYTRCNFWTSTEYSSTIGVSAEINGPTSPLWYTANKNKRSGLSIRLVKLDDNLPVTNSFTDFDGNNYRVVKIGNQVWLGENYRCSRLDNGTPIPVIEDPTSWSLENSIAMCMYNNDSQLF